MIKNLSDTSTAGNANADFTVSAKRSYNVLSGYVSLTTDATVASRYVTISVLDANSVVVFKQNCRTPQTASLTSQGHTFMPNIQNNITFVDGLTHFPIPANFIVQENQTLRISISNGVAGDTFAVYLTVDENSNLVHTL